MTPTNLEKQFIEKALPALAEVMARTMQDVKISMYQHAGEGKDTPFNFILMELMQVLKDRMELLRQKESTHAQTTET